MRTAKMSSGKTAKPMVVFGPMRSTRFRDGNWAWTMTVERDAVDAKNVLVLCGQWVNDNLPSVPDDAFLWAVLYEQEVPESFRVDVDNNLELAVDRELTDSYPWAAHLIQQWAPNGCWVRFEYEVKNEKGT